MSSKKYAFGVNRFVMNKNLDPATGEPLPDYTRLAERFENVELTLNELEAEVMNGYALCAQFKNGYKVKANFIQTQVGLMDVDKGELSILMNHWLVKEHAAFVYPSPSHRKDGNGDRFRIGWLLPSITKSRAEHEAILNALHDVKGLNEYADPMGRNCSQAMFGHKDAKFFLKEDRELPQSLIDEWTKDAEAKARAKAEEAAQRRVEAQARLAAMSEEETSLLKKELIRALNVIPWRVGAGSGRREECRNLIYAALSVFDEDTAYTIFEPKLDDDEWNLERVIYEGRGDISYTFIFDVAKKHDLTFKPDWQLFSVKRNKKLLHKVNDSIDREHLGDIPAVVEKLVCVVSGTGTGKTRALKKMIESSEKPCVIVYPTIALNAQIVAKVLGVKYYGDVTDWANQRGHIAITMDSLYKLNPEHYRDCIVVLDEPSPTVNRLMKLKENFKPRIESFRKLLARASKIITLEANLNDNTIDFVQALSGVDDADTYVLQNDYRKHVGHAYLYDSKGQCLARLAEDVAAGLKLFVVMDSGANGTEALQKYVEEKYPEKRVLVVHGNSDDELKKAVVQKREMLQEYDVVIISPCLFVGADISFEAAYFDKVYGFRELDTFTPSEFQQGLDRVRQIKSGELHLYVKTIRSSDSTLPETVYKNWLKNNNAFREVITFDQVADDDIFFQQYDEVMRAWSRLVAEGNYAKKYFADNMNAVLEAKGYTFEHVPDVEDGAGATAQESLIEAKREITKADKWAELNAMPLSKEEYDLLKKSNNKSRENRYELARYQAFRLNGYSNEDLEFVIDVGTQKLVPCVQRLEDMKLSGNELEAVQRSRNENLGMHQRHDYIGAARLNKKLIAALGGLETDKLLNDLPEFVSLCRKHASEVKRLLHISFRWNELNEPGNDHVLAGKFLKTLGLKKIRKQRRVGEDKMYDYWIDPDQRAVIFAILQRRVDYHVKARAEAEKAREEEANRVERVAADLARQEAINEGREFNGVVTERHLKMAAWDWIPEHLAWS